jgi:hypothetical protein
MEGLILRADFVRTPSESEQVHIEAELSKFLLKIVANAEVDVQSGQGSWWIELAVWSAPIALTVAGWLGLKFAERAVERSFDRVLDNIEQFNTITEKDTNQMNTRQFVQNQKQGMSEVENIQQKASDGMIPASMETSEQHPHLYQVMHGVKEMAHRFGCKLTIISVVDDHHRGFSFNPETDHFKVIEANSREAFNSALLDDE